jgi:hypothetical protein
MFESSAALAVFEHFRVPYRVASGTATRTAGLEHVAPTDSSAALFWPTEQLLAAEAKPPELHFMGSTPIFARILDEGQVGKLVRGLPGSWRESVTVRDTGGTTVGAVWRSDDGGALLPFDPNEALVSFWTERYADVGSGALATRARSVARNGYYWMRPLLPRDAQLRLRRAFSRLQRKSRFPRWPTEPAVDELLRFLLGLAADLADEPVPFIGVWPQEWAWALVLTHDVEKRLGYENIDQLLQIELEEGYRSAWNFVPCRDYVAERTLLGRLRENGFEIGVHGLFHDGRDLLPRMLPRRLSAMRSYADHWQAVGFRSPSLIRSAELIPLLGFDHDSSYPDTAPFEPQAGGCCTWLPYMLGNTVELPITLEQDHTLFELLGHRDATIWIEKARVLRDRGGMALVITHPDYVSNPFILDSYRSLLREFAADTSVWKALPREVAAWWRRRGESTLERTGDRWRVVGPAAEEARVELTVMNGFSGLGSGAQP